MKNTIKKITALFLVLTMTFTMVGCPGETGGSSPSPESTRIFTDDCGRDVEIPEKITKIVPSGSLAQIILLAIAPDMFAALSSSFHREDRDFIDPRLFSLPELGSLYADSDLNVEELAVIGPDIIIDIGDSKSKAADNLNSLQDMTQIPSVFIYSTLETMPRTYRTLGKLLGREERGEQLAQFCEKVYSRTVGIMDKVGENKVNALYVLGDKGLNVIAADSYHSEVMDLLTNNLAVVDNPMSKGTGNRVTMEQISLWNPDFVIFAPDSIYSTVKDIPTWNRITAITNNDYIEVPDAPHNWMSMPPSVQRYLGIIWLTAELYPDYCDYDVKADITEYYKLFYGCDLTDDMYAALTANAFRK